jgi:anti-sigma regulatory factor (Ser/Thr protein kinase)
MSIPALQLRLPARAENVALVRHAVAGVGEALGMDEESLANLRTVISEACNNAVIHAYEENQAGMFEVGVSREDDLLRLVVTDHGHGFQPRMGAPRTDPSLRLGLSLIASLSAGFELRSVDGGGTEVTIFVPITAPAEEQPREPVELLDETVLSVEDEALAGIVVSRVVSALAARASMSIDRLSDVLLLSDAIAGEHSDGFSGGKTRVAIEETGNGITIRVGPLHDGVAEQMLSGLAIPSMEASLVTLADEARVETREDGEHLTLSVASTHPASRS